MGDRAFPTGAWIGLGLVSILAIMVIIQQPVQFNLGGLFSSRTAAPELAWRVHLDGKQQAFLAPSSKQIIAAGPAGSGRWLVRRYALGGEPAGEKSFSAAGELILAGNGDTLVAAEVMGGKVHIISAGEHKEVRPAETSASLAFVNTRGVAAVVFKGGTNQPQAERIVSLDPDGTVRWTRSLPGESVMVLGGDAGGEYLAVASLSLNQAPLTSTVRGIDGHGDIVAAWPGLPGVVNLLAADTGSRFAAAADQDLWVFGAGGQWSSHLPERISALALDSASGRVAAAGEWSVTVMDGTGRLLWTRRLERGLRGLELQPDGSVIAGGQRHIHALDGRGNLRWRLTVRAGVNELATAGGILVAALGNGDILCYRLHPQSGGKAE